MVATFIKNRRMMFVPLLILASLCGCGGNDRGAAPEAQLPDVDPGIATLLRSRTDALLRDVVTRDTERIRGYFSPAAEVNVPEQLQRHFNMPFRRLRITEWDGRSIVVEYAPDKRRVRTGVAAKVSEGGRQPAYRVVVFTWVAADEKCQTYYLVPLAN